MKDTLATLLRSTRMTRVVDIGANPIDGDPPYKGMLDRGLCEVVGFEPQPDALRALQARGGPNERYFGHVIAAGGDRTFYHCEASGMSSLLEPDPQQLRVWNMFETFARVIRTEAVSTIRLDDVKEIQSVDFLKIDTQGSEIAILEGAERCLSEAVAVQTEVSFMPFYKGQPVFSEIDLFMRGKGFVPHTFAEFKMWPIAPFVVNNTPTTPVRQAMEADIVYVRDFRDVKNMTPEQWRQLAMITHHCYGSADLALKCIMSLIEMRELPASSGPDYVKSLMSLPA